MNQKLRIAEKLQALGENHLSKEIIKPLLESLGYLKVEFNGGPNERGKDIIIWDRDRLGGMKLIVAQVKHFKFTAAAADTAGLQTVVNQLENCISMPVMFTDQLDYLPSQVILISTYPIDNNALQSRFRNQYALKDKVIELIDGIRLAELLLDKRTDLVRELMGTEFELTSKLSSTYNNKIALNAIGFRGKLQLENIYTDLDISLGKLSTELFFTSYYRPSQKPLHLLYPDWIEFKEVLGLIESQFTIPILLSGTPEIALPEESMYEYRVNAEETENIYKRNISRYIEWERLL